MANSKRVFKPGDRFNKLVIIELSHIDSRKRKHFKVICDCGVIKTIQGALMSSNNTRSCGCYVKEAAKNRRISENHTEIYAIMVGYKRHAQKRGFIFSLTTEQFLNIIFKPCFYCGIEPSNRKVTKNSLNGGLFYSGVDRVNSSDHYTVDNCVPCCKLCNNAKLNLPLDAFKEWAIRLGKKAMAEQWG